MESAKTFKDLNVWQEAHKLVISIYEITNNFPKSETFGLISQLRRAAVSVTSNIAEGFARESYKEKAQFYSTARGSLTELENQLLIALDIKYIDKHAFEQLNLRLTSVHKLLNAFIRSTKQQTIPNSKFQILNSNQAGQSLIETIGAIFLLLTALSGGLALTLYAFQNSETTFDQIVASNLAREGIDVMRMMRDTNWLVQDAANQFDTNCGQGPPGNQNSANENPMDGLGCYANWMTAQYAIINGPNSSRSRLSYDSVANSWTQQSTLDAGGFHLCLQPNGTYQHTVACTNSTNPPFARRIRILQTTGDDYTPLNPLLQVESIVVWAGRNCPSIRNVNPADLNSPCKITVTEYLTNWRDYR